MDKLYVKIEFEDVIVQLDSQETNPNTEKFEQLP